ncbi:MAG: PAS domain S-box protein [bacterium]
MEGSEQRIAELERKVAMQQATIDAMMDELEKRQSTTEQTRFQTWARQAQFINVIQQKTESLQAALAKNNELTSSLQVSESFLSAVVDSLPIRLAILDGDGTVVRVNRIWREESSHLGPVEGGNLLAFYRVRSAAGEVPPQLHNAIASVIAQKFPTYLDHTEFGNLYFQTLVTRIPDTTHVLVAHLDITALIQAQKALERERRETELLSLVTRHTENPIVILDGNAKVTWTNTAFDQVSGMKITGQNALAVAAQISDDPGVSALLGEHIRLGRHYQSTHSMIGADGSRYYFRVELKPVAGESGTPFFMMVLNDVTENVRVQTTLASERKLLENVVSNVPHAIYWKDRYSRYQGCNEAFARNYGLTIGDIIGKRDNELIPGKDGALGFARENSVSRGGHPVLGVEETFESENGPQVMLTSRVPLIVDGQINGVLGIFADITAFKHMEQELNQARRLEAIGQLSAGIAHEINTPMQYIGDNIHFMDKAVTMLLDLADKVDGLAAREDGVGSDAREWLKQCRYQVIRRNVPGAIQSATEGVQTVSQIVQAMKAFAHPGGRELKMADINAGLTNTITVSRNEWKYVAEVETAFAAECVVRCNLGELNQVFLNLIVNAAQAIADGVDSDHPRGKIIVRTADLEDAVEVRVTDNGPGIPASVQPHVFEQFFTTKSVGKGTGQGLALARAVIERHHGTIDFETSSSGTTFRIRIPKNHVEQGAA